MKNDTAYYQANALHWFNSAQNALHSRFNDYVIFLCHEHESHEHLHE